MSEWQVGVIIFALLFMPTLLMGFGRVLEVLINKYGWKRDPGPLGFSEWAAAFFDRSLIFEFLVGMFIILIAGIAAVAWQSDAAGLDPFEEGLIVEIIGAGFTGILLAVVAVQRKALYRENPALDLLRQQQEEIATLKEMVAALSAKLDPPAPPDPEDDEDEDGDS